ncbi:MAG TPA: hypothetical protein VJX30_16685 [Terriglobales bacterium]|nr:hypothetical protein [Terriglobales bacterium]
MAREIAGNIAPSGESGIRHDLLMVIVDKSIMDRWQEDHEDEQEKGS